MSLTLNTNDPGAANHLQAKFLSLSLVSNERIDGRSFTECRIPKLLNVIPHNASVSVELTLGSTRILTVISFEKTQTNQNKPNEGVFSLKLNGLPSLFDKPSASELETYAYIHRLLETVYRFSKVVDLEKLCIRPGEEAWNLCASIIVLDSSDGNVIGASSYSLLCALHAIEMYNRLSIFKYPDVVLSYTPLMLYFSILQPDVDLLKNSKLNLTGIRSYILADPCQIEETHSAGDIVISIDSNTKEVFSIYKRGLSISSSELTTFIEKHSISMAKTILSSLREQLSSHINK